MADEIVCDKECRRFSRGAYIAVATIFGIIGASFAFVVFSWSSSGKIADHFNNHRYCVRMTAASCTGVSSTSNVTAEGYIMFDMGKKEIFHKLFMINAETNTPTELAVYGPRDITSPDLAELNSFLPSTGTLNITLDTDTNYIQGKYKLKTTERDDIDLAKAVIKNPFLYYIVLSTDEESGPAACSTLLSECSLEYGYDLDEYP